MRKDSFNIEEPVCFEAIYCGSLVFCEKNTSLFKTLFDQQKELTPCLVSKHSLSPPTLSLSLSVCLCLSFSLTCVCTHTHLHTCMHAQYTFSSSVQVCMDHCDWRVCLTIFDGHGFDWSEAVTEWLWLIRLSKWLFSVHIYRYAGAVTDSVANEVVYMAIFSTHLQVCRGCYRQCG